MLKASDIKERMKVLGSDGKPVGIVDHLEGTNRIKLAKHDAKDGKHHFIALAWVDHVDQNVHLNKTSRDAMAQWQTAA